MNRFVREIRTAAGLSQEEFAQRLGVSFATINRWENSRAVPNNLAQNTLYDFCREENIPAGDLILKKIQNEVASLDIPTGRTVLFHESKSGIRGKSDQLAGSTAISVRDSTWERIPCSP